MLGSLEKDGVNFGRFDLEFAVDLLEFVLQQEHARRCVVCSTCTVYLVGVFFQYIILGERGGGVLSLEPDG